MVLPPAPRPRLPRCALRQSKMRQVPQRRQKGFAARFRQPDAGAISERAC